MKRFFKEEKGSGTIIEYTIVFPIVMIIIGLLIFLGFVQFEKAVIVSAAQRGSIMSARMLADPHYAEVTGTTDPKKDYKDIGSIDMKSFSSDTSSPYRYIFDGSKDFDDGQLRIEAIIAANSVFFKPETTVDVKKKNQFISKRIEVTITKRYKLFKFTDLLGMPDVGTIEYSIETESDNPVEFIRNVDLADDLVRDFTGEDIKKHVDNIFSKVNDLIKKLGG